MDTTRPRYQFLKEKYAAFIAEKIAMDKTAQRAGWPEDRDEIFGCFAMIDPTAEEKRKPLRYLDWLAWTYEASFKDGGQGIKAEDFYKITEHLKVFDEHKKTLDPLERDINRYTYDDLVKLSRSLSGKEAPSMRELMRRKRSEIDEQTTVVYEGPEGLIVVPHSMKASIFWGQNTEWCTAAHTSENYFYDYNDESPLFIFIPSGQNGKRFQYHRSCWYMDERDQEIEEEDDCFTEFFGEMIAKYWDAQNDYEDYKEEIESEKTEHASKNLERLTKLASTGRRKDALAAVKENGMMLSTISSYMKADREIVLAAVSQNGLALSYVDVSLLLDSEIVMAAVSQNGEALQYAHDTLKADRDIVLAAVSQDGMALEDAPAYRANYDVVLAAVSQNGAAIQFSSASMRSDREIVRAALSNNGYDALEHAHTNFRSDREIVLEAVRADGTTLDYVDEELLRREPEIYGQCVYANLSYLTSLKEWHRVPDSQKEKIFNNSLVKNWRNIQCVHDFVCDFTHEQELEVLRRALQESPDKPLAHYFPSFQNPEGLKLGTIRAATERFFPELLYENQPENNSPAGLNLSAEPS